MSHGLPKKARLKTLEVRSGRDLFSLISVRSSNHLTHLTLLILPLVSHCLPKKARLKILEVRSGRDLTSLISPFTRQSRMRSKLSKVNIMRLVLVLVNQ